MAEFQQINVNDIGIMAAGGTVDLSRSIRNNQTGATEQREYLAMRPEVARRVADALLKAADAADGLPGGFWHAAVE